MDSKEYKKITSSRNVLGYNVLHDTINILEDRRDLIDCLLETMNEGKIEKPLNHNSKEDVFTTFYYINIPNDILLQIFDALTERINLDKNGDIEKASIVIDNLVERWWQLIDFDEINYKENQ